MIKTKSSPQGRDYWIDTFIKHQERILIPLWVQSNSLATTDTCIFYGRTTLIDDKIRFQTSTDLEYVETDSKMDFKSYVTCGSTTRTNGLSVIESTLVCQANLKRLYPNISERADEELVKDVENALLDCTEYSYYSGYEIESENEVKNTQPYCTVTFKFNICI